MWCGACAIQTHSTLRWSALEANHSALTVITDTHSTGARRSAIADLLDDRGTATVGQLITFKFETLQSQRQLFVTQSTRLFGLSGPYGRHQMQSLMGHCDCGEPSQVGNWNMAPFDVRKANANVSCCCQ